MQVVDASGNVYGASGLEIIGSDGKPKTTGGGGGSPTGPAGGDLTGTYPNPGVNWSSGLPTYDLSYYPLSSNPSGYLTSITSGDIITALGYTPYNSANPTGYITSAALSPYLTSAAAALTYQPLLGYTPENVSNKSTSTSLGTSNTLYPTQNAVKTYVDNSKYILRHSFATPLDYIGRAPTGTAESSPVWNIVRLTTTLSGTSLSQTATGAWTNRTSLIYT